MIASSLIGWTIVFSSSNACSLELKDAHVKTATATLTTVYGVFEHDVDVVICEACSCLTVV
jgi:hypothetical protein